MSTRSHNPWPRLSRALAWLPALLLLWMGTAGTLHHTDDGPLFAASSSRAALSHATPAAPADSCAACQWTQGMQSGTLSVCPVVRPLTFVVVRRAPAAGPARSRPPRLRSPRAPPTLLS